MTRLIYAVRQFLPSMSSILVYWLVVVSLIVVAAMGLKETGKDTASLWGLPLRGFGGESREILVNAYLEMMYHAWTFITLPFACFIGMKPLVKSFRRDFDQFLRYSRSSRLFIEVSRESAICSIVVGLSLPFVAGVLWGTQHMGVNWHEGLHGLASCGGIILFVCVLIYLLASLGIAAEISLALAFVTPFFLTGLLAYLEKVETSAILRQILPLGLPYSTYTLLSSASCSFVDPNVRAGIVFALTVIAVRCLFAVKTRWLIVTTARDMHKSCRR